MYRYYVDKWTFDMCLGGNVNTLFKLQSLGEGVHNTEKS